MKNIFLLFTVILIASACAQKKVDIDFEKANVKTVLDQFIQATKDEDIELFSNIYAHDSDIVNFGTEGGERIVGWDNLKELMQQQFDSTQTTDLAVRDQDIKVHQSGMVAWFSEIIDWSIISNDQEVKLEGLRASGVLENREGKWVIVQVHYSMPANS